MKKHLRYICIALLGLNLGAIKASPAHAVWQIPKKAPITLSGQRQDIFAIDMSPDGKLIASSSFDGTTRVWNTSSGEMLFDFPGHANWVGDVAFHPTEPILVSAGLDGKLQMWSLETGKKVDTFETFEKALLSVTFSPDGKRLAVGGKSKTISLFDWKTRKKLAQLKGHSGSVVNLAFSPDGKTLASVSFNDLAIMLWNMDSFKLAHRLVDHREELYAIAFSPDGKYLASGGADRIIRLWSLQTLLPIQQLAGHLKPVWSLAFDPKSKTLASGTVGDNTLRFWSVPSGANIETLNEVSQNTYDMLFTADGKNLWTSHREGIVKRWENVVDTTYTVSLPQKLEALRVDIGIEKSTPSEIELTLKQKSAQQLRNVSVTVELLTPGVELLSPSSTFFIPLMESASVKHLGLRLQTESVIPYIDLRLSIQSETPAAQVVLPLRIPLAKP